MRILFLTADYPELLQSLAPADRQAGYAALVARRNASLFARLDYLVDALAVLGHRADAFYVNNLPLQERWIAEHGASALPGGVARRAVYRLRRTASSARVALNHRFGDGTLAPAPDARFDTRNPRMLDIVERQIRSLRPDVVYNLDPVLIDGRFLAGLKPVYGALVGQIAAPYPQEMDWRPYDLVISSLPNFVARFAAAGVNAAALPLYFAPQVLSEIGPRNRDVPLSFVGSVTRAHGGRRRFLEQIAEALPLAFHGTLLGEPAGTPLARAYRGPAWGRGMYEVLGRSMLTLNRHIDIAESYANNLRLYEATGMGACLLTERGRNLHELFEPDREVVTYEGIEDCIEKTRYYLARPEAASVIAMAGQKRCLADHTVMRHAERMAAILSTRL
jgi:hypothetical protein